MRMPLHIRREEDDPMALRASIGGNDHVGFYLVYRGDPEKVLEMLREVVQEAEKELGYGRSD